MKKINLGRKTEIAIVSLQKRIAITKQVRNSIVSAIKETLKTENVRHKYAITVCLTTDGIIKKINRKYLNKNQPTDVISFNLEEPSLRQGILTDIVVSVDTAIRNTRIFQSTVIKELTLYTIHGLLHSLGYDDNTAGGRKLMDKKTLRILSNL